MQTHFSPAQLLDPRLAEVDRILRACVHCGFCTATCPTYVLKGDERDSPRGRIYLIKDMLENGRPASAEEVGPIDRCLSCLSCTSTCPSGVDYMHLVDHARAYIEETYERPRSERLVRALIARVLPYPGRFRLALQAAALGRPFAGLLERAGLAPLAAMLRLAPRRVPPAARDAGVHAPAGPRKARVALLAGCAQQVLQPAIDAAAIRLLNRMGVEVVRVAGQGCCGALPHHMGRTEEARAFARANVRAFEAAGPLDALLVTASGCGTTLKDYGHMLAGDAAFAGRAAALAGKVRDITEFLAAQGLPDVRGPGGRVAYHSACSLQHGQKVKAPPVALLRQAGFEVVEPFDPHLCCGSAGTYNMLQPDLAEALKTRKVDTLEALQPQMIAAGNIGCLTQIAAGTALPVVHTVELLDWATGGPRPAALAPPATA